MNDFLWGLKMTGVGMGTVFLLLALLMGLLMLISRSDRPRRTPVADEAPTAPPLPDHGPRDAPQVEILDSGLTPGETAAVAIAVITHAAVRRQQAAPEMRTHAPGSQIHTSRWVSVGRSNQNASWRR